MLTKLMLIRFISLFLLAIVPIIAQSSLQASIDELLAEAEQALAKDRLTSPIDDNAFDRYQAVLLLDKGNERAAMGIRNIVERYMAMSQSKLKRGDFNAARKLLVIVVKINGENAMTRQQTEAIQSAELKWRQSLLALSKNDKKPVAPIPRDQTIFHLDPRSLSKRSRFIIDQLFALGLRVQETREYVLIYARNDAEGRWIYQQMRKASNGYRMRGNIKRHKKPRVVLEPPLES